MRDCAHWPRTWFTLSPESPPSLQPQDRSAPVMRNYPTVDRESFQELLASAFAVQQMDSQSRSTLVEIGRSVTKEISTSMRLYILSTTPHKNWKAQGTSPLAC